MDSSFRTRIFSVLLLAPVLVALTLLGPIPFSLLLLLIVALCAFEMSSLLRGLGWEAPRFLVLLAPLFLAGTLGGWLGASAGPLASVTSSIAVLWLIWPRSPLTPKRGPTSWVVHTLGALYLGVLLGHLGLLREGPWKEGPPLGTGARWVFYALLVTWSCDTGAYAAGRLFGRHALWEEVSPSKTREGALGGIALSILAALAVRPFLVPGLSVPWAAFLGVLVGIGAQVGDLIESRLKRKAGVKDSGSLIPGHGGALDRFDSLVFTAPLFFYYLQAFGR